MMKLAVAIAHENAAPSAFVVWRGFRESVRKAAEFGYHGVELALRTAADINPDELAGLLSKWKLEVGSISTGQVFSGSGLYFTHQDQAVREKAVDTFKNLILLAKDFGRMVNIGRARGFVAPNQSREAAEKLFIDTAERICEIAAQHGVTMVLEPVNRYETNFINKLDEGSELVSKLKYGNMGLMPDVFHMNIEEAGLGASLRRNAPLIRYIHFADSNRLAPGQGHLNFDEVFDSLKTIGFNGWAAVEILPEPDPDTAAEQAARFILPRIAKYNEAQDVPYFQKVEGADLNCRG